MQNENNPTREQVAGKLRKINYALRALPNVTEFKEVGSKNETYHIMRREAVTWTCTCPDFRFRVKKCKHIKRYSF